MSDVAPATAARTKAPPSSATAPPAAKAVPAAPIGILPNGQPVLASFHPSVASLALSLTPYLTNTADLSNVLPLPTGLALQRAPEGGKQLQLVLQPLLAGWPPL